jgi:hypothetical protein
MRHRTNSRTLDITYFYVEQVSLCSRLDIDMSSIIHFRFRSDKDFGTVKFDGSSLTMSDLKLEIVRQKKLGGVSDTELIISDAQTGEGK